MKEEQRRELSHMLQFFINELGKFYNNYREIDGVKESVRQIEKKLEKEIRKNEKNFT